MFIPKRLLKACAKPDDIKHPERLQAIYVDVERKRAWASDGFIAVSCPIEPEEGECSGFVSREAVEMADKHARMLKGKLFHGETETKVAAGGTFDNPSSGLRFPVEQCEEIMQTGGRERVLYVDIALLKRACEVLGVTQVSIYHAGDEGKSLYMENDRGERVVVATLALERVVRDARQRMRQHVSEEGLDA